MVRPLSRDPDVFGVSPEPVVESNPGDTFLQSVRADFGDGMTIAKSMASGNCTRFCYSDNPLGVTGFSRIRESLRLEPMFNGTVSL